MQYLCRRSRARHSQIIMKGFDTASREMHISVPVITSAMIIVMELEWAEKGRENTLIMSYYEPNVYDLILPEYLSSLALKASNQ